MERETSSLLIKSNRVLGTRLVEAGLTSLENMENANEVFIQRARAKDLRRASLLRILIYDHQTLKEEQLLDYQLKNLPVGALMLENYQIDPVLLDQHPEEFMQASWTVPIDFQDNRWFVATAYYLSDIVRKFWEDRLGGRISWLVTTLNQIDMIFDEQAARKGESEEQTLEKSEA